MALHKQSIRWADGTYDSKRTCDECGSETCPFPVHNDYYKEVVTSKTYWDWMNENDEKENKQI